MKPYAFHNELLGVLDGQKFDGTLDLMDIRKDLC